MARVYCYRAPELSGEKLLELFLVNQDLCDKDTPVTQNSVNAFFLNCIEEFFEYYDYQDEDDHFPMNALIREIEHPDIVVMDGGLILGGGETVIIDGNKIALPYLLLKVKQYERI